jgi:hypothetical protein
MATTSKKEEDNIIEEDFSKHPVDVNWFANSPFMIGMFCTFDDVREINSHIKGPSSKFTITLLPKDAKHPLMELFKKMDEKNKTFYFFQLIRPFLKLGDHMAQYLRNVCRRFGFKFFAQPPNVSAVAQFLLKENNNFYSYVSTPAVALTHEDHKGVLPWSTYKYTPDYFCYWKVSELRLNLFKDKPGCFGYQYPKESVLEVASYICTALSAFPAMAYFKETEKKDWSIGSFLYYLNKDGILNRLSFGELLTAMDLSNHAGVYALQWIYNIATYRPRILNFPATTTLNEVFDTMGYDLSKFFLKESPDQCSRIFFKTPCKESTTKWLAIHHLNDAHPFNTVLTRVHPKWFEYKSTRLGFLTQRIDAKKFMNTIFSPSLGGIRPSGDNLNLEQVFKCIQRFSPNAHLWTFLNDIAVVIDPETTDLFAEFLHYLVDSDPHIFERDPTKQRIISIVAAFPNRQELAKMCVKTPNTTRTAKRAKRKKERQQCANYKPFYAMVDELFVDEDIKEEENEAPIQIIDTTVTQKVVENGDNLPLPNENSNTDSSCYSYFLPHADKYTETLHQYFKTSAINRMSFSEFLLNKHIT